MLKSKKIISAILAFSMAIATPVAVYASDRKCSTESMICAVNSADSINWTYTSWVGSWIGFENDYAECIGSYELYGDMKSKITLTLMKSKDGNSWSKVESWSTTNYSYSPNSFIMTSTNKLEHGYYYLTYAQVQVYDSTGEVVETSHSESAGKYYA